MTDRKIWPPPPIFLSSIFLYPIFLYPFFS